VLRDAPGKDDGNLAGAKPRAAFTNHIPTLKGSDTALPTDGTLVVFHSMFARKLKELALDFRRLRGAL
jgi:hypothetical protein